MGFWNGFLWGTILSPSPRRREKSKAAAVKAPMWLIGIFLLLMHALKIFHF
jgi:hypothetical protein